MGAFSSNRALLILGDQSVMMHSVLNRVTPIMHFVKFMTKEFKWDF